MTKHNQPYKFKNPPNRQQRCIVCGDEIEDGEIVVRRFDGRKNGHLVSKKASGHIQHAREFVSAKGEPIFD